MTLFNDRKGASPPNEPRLSPNTTSLGRCPSGIALISASTASNSACPACLAFSLSTRNDSQLGRNEYCMLTIAVLPLYMYSSADASASLIQPVPVVVATATTSRESPPVRRSSSAASAAVALMPSAECSPAYARIGSIAGLPLNFESSSTAGPADTNTLPWWPSDSQSVNDSGPPDRNFEFGAGKSGSVSSLTVANVLLRLSIPTRTTTPFSSAILSARSKATTTTRETRGGATRFSCRTRNRTSLPMSWPISTKMNNTTIASTAVSGCSQNPIRGTSLRSRTSSCQMWK